MLRLAHLAIICPRATEGRIQLSEHIGYHCFLEVGQVRQDQQDSDILI